MNTSLFKNRSRVMLEYTCDILSKSTISLAGVIYLMLEIDFKSHFATECLILKSISSTNQSMASTVHFGRPRYLTNLVILTKQDSL